MGQRVILKVMQIIREEMERSGAQEVLMPIITPGGALARDGPLAEIRQGTDAGQGPPRPGLRPGPTHEEVITDLVRRELKSYKQLPMNLFQIATKFRDEVRPRFGVMRSREFLMKDGYSFDVDDAASDKTYWTMYRGLQAHLQTLWA